jgi:hypothetical protein
MTTSQSFPCRGRLLVPFLAAVLAVAGCSGGGVKKTTIHGTVTYQGKKLRSGLISFSGPDGALARGRIHSDGTYTVTDVVPGETTLSVLAEPQSTGRGGSEEQGPPVVLPDKYRTAEASDYKVDIKPGTTELDIEFK